MAGPTDTVGKDAVAQWSAGEAHAPAGVSVRASGGEAVAQLSRGVQQRRGVAVTLLCQQLQFRSRVFRTASRRCQLLGEPRHPRGRRTT